ncbi:MAG: recombination mediator RecR [bacterium]
MKSYPKAITDIITRLSILPGVGYRTGERYAYFLLRQDQQAVQELATAIAKLQQSVKFCQRCYSYTETSPCSLCSDRKRLEGLLCVVADPQDIPPLEQTKAYEGKYFVLGGTLNPLEGVHPDNLRIKELLKRIREGMITEVILALDPDSNGEATSFYLARILKQEKIKVTKLAKGLPLGSAIEYADEITLENALSNRKEI